MGRTQGQQRRHYQRARLLGDDRMTGHVELAGLQGPHTRPVVLLSSELPRHWDAWPVVSCHHTRWNPWGHR